MCATKGIWDILPTITLIVTLIILIWYAWETRGLRIQSAKQYDFMLQPCIILFWSDGHFLLKNVGHSAALNIHISDVGTATDLFEFPIYHILDSKDITRPIIAHRISTQIRFSDLWKIEEKFQLEIIYTNIFGEAFSSQLQLDREAETIILTKTGKVNPGKRVRKKGLE
jgi:hypothetical protein